jgi:hypothetical protein
MDILSIIMGIVFCSLAGLFAYGSFHMAEEQRRGKQYPFIWERWFNDKK